MRTIDLTAERTVEAVDGVHLTQLAAGDRLSIQHYHIEPDATVPNHSHEHEQCGYVTAGTLTLQCAGDEETLGPGESYVITGDEPHSAANRGDGPVEGLDVFAPPRTNPPWSE